MPFLPPMTMTGNGFYIPPIKMVMTGDGANGIVLPTLVWLFSAISTFHSLSELESLLWVICTTQKQHA